MKRKKTPAYYGLAIAVFGVLVPGLIFALVAGLGVGLYSWLDTERTFREERYQLYLSNEAETKALASTLLPSLPKIDYISDLVSTGDQVAKLSSLLATKERELPAESLAREAVKPSDVGDNNPLGPGSNLGVQNISLTYAGRYSSMQRLAIETEMLMPNLFMRALNIAKQEGSEKVLTFNISYYIFSQGGAKKTEGGESTPGAQL